MPLLHVGDVVQTTRPVSLRDKRQIPAGTIARVVRLWIGSELVDLESSSGVILIRGLDPRYLRRIADRRAAG